MGSQAGKERQVTVKGCGGGGGQLSPPPYPPTTWFCPPRSEEAARKLELALATSRARVTELEAQLVTRNKEIEQMQRLLQYTQVGRLRSG